VDSSTWARRIRGYSFLASSWPWLRGCAEWVHGRQNLNRWPKERVVADTNAAHIQHDAIEVEEYALT